jgi:hypothetical protein
MAYSDSVGLASPRHQLAHADLGGIRFGRGDVGFRESGGQMCADVETRAGARFDQAAGLQEIVCLQYSRDADRLLAAQVTHGGEAVARTEGAGFDQVGDVGRYLLVFVGVGGTTHTVIITSVSASHKVQFAPGERGEPSSRKLSRAG